MLDGAIRVSAKSYRWQVGNLPHGALVENQVLTRCTQLVG
jgi:hypothetical protein